MLICSPLPLSLLILYNSLKPCWDFWPNPRQNSFLFQKENVSTWPSKQKCEWIPGKEGKSGLPGSLHILFSSYVKYTAGGSSWLLSSLLLKKTNRKSKKGFIPDSLFQILVLETNTLMVWKPKKKESLKINICQRANGRRQDFKRLSDP